MATTRYYVYDAILDPLSRRLQDGDQFIFTAYKSSERHAEVELETESGVHPIKLDTAGTPVGVGYIEEGVSYVLTWNAATGYMLIAPEFICQLGEGLDGSIVDAFDISMVDETGDPGDSAPYILVDLIHSPTLGTLVLDSEYLATLVGTPTFVEEYSEQWFSGDLPPGDPENYEIRVTVNAGHSVGFGGGSEATGVWLSADTEREWRTGFSDTSTPPETGTFDLTVEYRGTTDPECTASITLRGDYAITQPVCLAGASGTIAHQEEDASEDPFSQRIILTVNDDGEVTVFAEEEQGSLGSWVTLYGPTEQWHWDDGTDTGVLAGFEVYLEVTGGAVSSGDAPDTWLPLVGSRSWTTQGTWGSSGWEPGVLEGTLTVRNIADTECSTSATVNLRTGEVS